MRTPLQMSVARVSPGPARVMSALGMTDETAARRHAPLVANAIDLYAVLAEPAGVWDPIGLDAFGSVYHGNGEDVGSTPLAQIYPRAHALALFAVTLGDRISTEIEDLFRREDFALGAVLDAAASEGAEMAAAELEASFADHLRFFGGATTDSGVMRFSPGYCGWPTSGQKALFAQLRPSEIGIELSASCLMRPLKSISGVFVAGPREIFLFEDNFPFCIDCDTHSCRERITALGRITPHHEKEGSVP